MTELVEGSGLENRSVSKAPRVRIPVSPPYLIGSLENLIKIGEIVSFIDNDLYKALSLGQKFIEMSQESENSF